MRWQGTRIAPRFALPTLGCASTCIPTSAAILFSSRARRRSAAGSSPDTASVITDSDASSASLCEPYRELITRWIDDGRTGTSVFQELVEKHGFAARYATVQRFVRKLHGETSPEARVVIATKPGEESQVDYGDGPMVRDSANGKYKRMRLFLLTLAHSRKAVRLLTWKSSTKIWAQLHERAFRRLGGATATVVLDNLREGVLKPDVYDPLLNPLYRDVLAHYGV